MSPDVLKYVRNFFMKVVLINGCYIISIVPYVGKYGKKNGKMMLWEDAKKVLYNYSKTKIEFIYLHLFKYNF